MLGTDYIRAQKYRVGKTVRRNVPRTDYPDKHIGILHRATPGRAVVAALLLGGAEYLQQGLALAVGRVLRFHVALDLEEDDLGSVLGHGGVSMRGPGRQVQ